MSAHYNVILAGQYGVGKTSIFRRLQHCERMEDSGNDRGLDRITYLTKKGDKDIEVNLWDTGGIERYRGPLSANYYRHCNAIILVYRQGDQQSLVALGEWSNDCKSYCLMKDQVMLSLWENVDNEAPSLDEHLVKDFMEHNGIPSTLRFKVCTKTGHSVKEAFESVIRTLDDRCTRVGLGQSDEMQQHYIDLKTLGRPSDAVSTSSDKATCHC